MTEYVVLDSEAVSALASPRERGASARRAQAVLVAAERRSALVRIPAAVLVEVYRGTGRDAAIDRIAQNWVIALDARIARLAGRMLGRRKLDSRHAVDAIVVATAAALGPSVILTGDPLVTSPRRRGVPKDLSALAAEHRHVAVVALP